MALSTLMACLHLDRSNAGLLAVVGDVAERFKCSVIGVAVKQATAHADILAAGPHAPHEHNLKRFAEHASAAETEFRAALSKVDNLDWRATMTCGPAYHQVADEARAADLVIASVDRHDRSLLPSGEASVGDLLMRVGRPLLAAPADAAGFRFGQALVCFKDTREARRAVADAVPILQAMIVSTSWSSSMPRLWTKRDGGLATSATGWRDMGSMRPVRPSSPTASKPLSSRAWRGTCRPI